MKVVIIIPTYNEKENIGQLIDFLQEKVFNKITSKFQMHILVIDDNSPDGTLKVVKQKFKKFSNVHLLINEKKMGLGKAYMLGMDYAVQKLKADIMFEMDADFSHDPLVIPKFLKKIEDGYDLVLGTRYIKGGSIPKDWGLHRKFMSIFGNLTVRVILNNYTIHDWTTGYRAIRKELYLSLRKDMKRKEFSGYTFQIGFLHKAVRKGFKVGEVPIHFVDRKYGKSKIGAEYIKNTLKYIFLIRIKELQRVIKFATVGAIGAIVQLSSLSLYRFFLPYQLAFFLSVETSIISNFIWSNLWTFADRQLEIPSIPKKFVQFNFASMGSLLIQQAIAFMGEFTIGLIPIFSLPLVQIKIDSGTLYAVIGIFIGMFWNFYAYNHFIWKVKHP